MVSRTKKTVTRLARIESSLERLSPKELAGVCSAVIARSAKHREALIRALALSADKSAAIKAGLHLSRTKYALLVSALRKFRSPFMSSSLRVRQSEAEFLDSVYTKATEAHDHRALFDAFSSHSDSRRRN